LLITVHIETLRLVVQGEKLIRLHR
jgi:hypothetical protein